jgi:hypothetical protein
MFSTDADKAATAAASSSRGRMTRRPGASVSISTVPPVAVVGRPDAVRGVEVEPVDGPAQPRRAAPHGGHRKQRYAGAGRKVQPQPGRREEHHVTLADHDAPVSGPRDQRVEHGKLVVEPCTGEADGEHERHVQMPERLVEIRAVLFGDLVDPCRREPRPEGLREIESRSPTTATGTKPAATAASAPPSTATRVGPTASAASRSACLSAPPPTRVTGVDPETTGCSGVFFWSSTATISIEWPYSRRVLLESSWSGQQQSDTVR